MRGSIIAIVTAGLAIAMPLAAQTASAPARTVVQTRDELPRYRYPLPGGAVEMLNADDAAFLSLAGKVAADIDGTLARYDVADRAALRRMLNTRLSYEVLAGRNEAALATIGQIRALEDKPDRRLTSNLRLEAIVKARIASGASSGPAYEDAYARLYAEALGRLPWAVVANDIREAKSNTQILTAALAEGVVRSDIEPAVRKDGALSNTLADDLLWARLARTVEVPLRDRSIAALDAYIAANKVDRPDIWPTRSVTLTAADRPTPVVVAVWDSGVDLSLFPGRAYRDPKAGRGAPYTGHGTAFDVESHPAGGTLYPLTAEQQAGYAATLGDFQGLADLQAGIDSPAADAFRTRVGALPADKAPGFFETMSLYGNYLHGTHVAGIVAEGNPAVRIAVARLTFDHRNVRIPPSEDYARRTAAAYATTVDWFKVNGVRVVNMSWGGSPADYERDLASNGIGKDAAERKALARRYFQIDRDGLFAALKGAPGILFVAAAGNSNSDNGFDEAIPSSFVLPNLLTVSAVDRAGDEAGFTSYGRNVVVSANGYQVDSTVPGGKRLMSSGTSMAAPAVTNLAAKLIALDPRLTPERTIVLIRAGATASEDGRRHNIDPKASVALLRKQAGR